MKNFTIIKIIAAILLSAATVSTFSACESSHAEMPVVSNHDTTLHTSTASPKPETTSATITTKPQSSTQQTTVDTATSTTASTPPSATEETATVTEIPPNNLPETTTATLFEVNFHVPKLKPQDYTYTAEMANYYKDFAIVGDSLCSSFAYAGYFAQEQNLARANIGTRNIHEFKIFNNKKEQDVLLHLYEMQPKYVMMLMGMNDVNLIDNQMYASNYKQIITDCISASPNTEYIVMAMTPVVNGCFCDNKRIDVFNNTLKIMIKELNNPHVHFVDPSDYLKTKGESMIEEYADVDGVHLSGGGQAVCLWYLYNRKITYSFTEDNLQKPKKPDTSMYTYLY